MPLLPDIPEAELPPESAIAPPLSTEPVRWFSYGALRVSAGERALVIPLRGDRPVSQAEREEALLRADPTLAASIQEARRVRRLGIAQTKQLNAAAAAGRRGPPELPPRGRP